MVKDPVKKTAWEIYKQMPSKVTTDFEQNKKLLNELGLSLSKTLRNKIAGYLVRVKKRMRKWEEAGHH